MLQNARFTAFTVSDSELLGEKQQVVSFKII